MQPPLSNTAGSLPKVRIIGFTGHRHLRNPAAVGEAIRAELATLRQEGKELIAISSIAIGADTVFAREVLRAGIKWIVVLPMAREVFRDDFSPEEWAAAEQLIAQASEIRILRGTDRPQAYVDCGKATVDDSDSLFAVWDGNPARGEGGTAEIITYAQMLGRKLTLFRVDGARVEKVEPPTGSLAESEAEDILKMMGPPGALPAPPQRLVDHFTNCDDMATKMAPNFRSHTLWMAQLHLAATLVAGLALSIDANRFELPQIDMVILSFVKVACVSFALWILLSLRRRRTHEIWLEHRLAAEYCRSMLATWHCRDFIEPASFQEVEELKGLAQATLFLRLEKGRGEPIDIQNFRTAYAHNRVMTQLNYFRREWDKAKKKAEPLRTRYRFYTYSAVVFSGLLFLHRLVEVRFNWFDFWPELRQAGMVLLEVYPLLFPALATFTITRMAIDEVDRRLGRFEDLKEKMRVTLIDLYYCGSWESLSRSVQRTEKILFNEVREWFSISWYSPNE